MNGIEFQRSESIGSSINLFLIVQILAPKAQVGVIDFTRTAVALMNNKRPCN
jgi:hypothetical protein